MRCRFSYSLPSQPFCAITLKTLAAALFILYAQATSSCAAERENEVELSRQIRLAQEWANASFAKPIASGKPLTASASSEALVILSKSNHVHLNRSVWNTPLKLRESEYQHGIYMDAPASIQILLGQPAMEFTAQVGIDHNSSTEKQRESGSACFHVLVDGKRVFSTPVLKLSDGAVEVKVPLNGAKDFVIEVDDGGNGRNCDQCVWANAEVKFQDETRVFLDKLPFETRRMTKKTTMPFSFEYDGVSSEALLPDWEYSSERQEVEGGLQRIIFYKCPTTGLLLECHLTTYSDLPGVDWVFYLENRSETDTPIIDSFLPLDATLLEAREKQSVTLRWSRGDDNHPSESVVSHLPHDEPLAPNQLRKFAAIGGRSSNAGRLRDGISGGVLPFFNCLGPNEAWVVAVGWSGQWAAEFARESDGSVTVGAGMEKTHFRLHPGERIRTPRIVLLRYGGDAMIKGHNYFRKLMLKHYVHREDGEPAVPPICHNTAATVYRSGKKATEKNQLLLIEEAAELGCEAYWLDAYWYPQPWSSNVGNWFPRPEDFPRGLRPLGDAAHQAGMKFVLWFEPERVQSGTQFFRDHPEYLLGEVGSCLFNLGDPKARKFLTEFLDKRIKEWGVDIYRNDFNMDPLSFWQKNDQADRQGISEIRYISGLYQMWSELIHRNPGLTIDNCASGGRRIDVEICSLSYPLWRSDLNDIGQGLKGESHWPLMARSDQVHNAGLNLYIPFHSGPLWDMHPYSLRSAMNSTVVVYERILHKGFPSKLATQGIAEIKQLRPLWLGDIYPLMDLTTSQKDWYAFQLHRADLEEGCALFFRRSKSSDVTRNVSLKEIDPNATYQVSITGETYEQAPWQKLLGSELIHQTINIEAKGNSALLRYRRLAANRAE